MNQLQVIEQREVLGKGFTVYGDLDQPLFLAKDVAGWIEHSNPRSMLRTVDESEKAKISYPVNNPYGGYQEEEQWFLTEDGVYEVLMQSRKPIAKQFKKQVKEILKSIRKHGMYAKDEILDNPDLLLDVVTKLKDERDKRLTAEMKALALEQQVAEYEPKITYLDQILQSKDAVTITQIAKDYGMSGTKLNQILNEEGVQYKQNGQWLLYRKYHDKGYTKSQTIPIHHTDGSQSVKMNTRWTQKGRLFIHELLQKRNISAMIDRKDIGA
ncbi:phage antirepressor [Brevibacillus laterosporus]|uniref:phage antirepressor n=1 Tax=Brevibacillus laterosporus TaxID=1465 RepID=UPI0014447D07|nr:phage antirepressor KilAC domain-containing protein [Brevibacillus laterosporus]NKQ18401.1 phage antirepressor protein [Brevibacillus laterosporus]WNX33168.1 phage antirepressor KilAC domain-containing protein [Brevibacillus laterosporus]